MKNKYICLEVGTHLYNIKDKTKKIYRVCELSHLFEVFELNTMGLTTPYKWDDPYEKFLSSCYGIDGSDNNRHWNFEGYAKLIFGQCWTLNIENDATWRIYSPNKNKVKIRTTIKKLYDVISQFNDELSYIGKVKYKDERIINDQITKGIREPLKSFSPKELFENYYLIKRKEFSHEKEVRLLIKLSSLSEKHNPPKISQSSDGHVCYIPVNNPNEFIEEVVFDPRMSDSLVQAYTYYLQKYFNYSNTIYKSSLYTIPDIIEKIKSPLS